MSLEILLIQEIQEIPFLLHFLESLLLHLHQASLKDPLVLSGQHHPLALDLLHHQEVPVVLAPLVLHLAQAVPLLLPPPELQASWHAGLLFCQQILQPYVKTTHLLGYVLGALALLAVLEYRALRHILGDP